MGNAKTPHFGTGLFSFLRDLKANNDRDWFNENKGRYEDDVKAPLLRFISDFAPALGKISPRFVADPRPTGGSLFRIYRDTRFSNDKSPYKTMAAAQFRHERGKDVHAPGFYLHLEPGSVFAGMGMWHPDAQALAGVREAIVTDPAGWKKAVGAKAFLETFDREGESLKRPPRGFDPEHPLIEDLRRKDHIAVARFTEKDAWSADFLDRFTRTCRASEAFMEFLTRAVGLDW